MGSPWNWVSAQGSEKTRMMGLPDGRKSFKIGLAVLIQYRRVTDSQPPKQPASHVAVASTRYAYLRRAVKTIFNMAAVLHLEFLMTASYYIINCILCSQLCVKFSRRSVAYTFWNILYFMFQHFGLKLSISGLILTIFWWKIGRSVKIKYSNPQNAQPWP